MGTVDSRLKPTFELEAAELQLHGGPVAGVDEAGRGPLAGPVVAAAVILDRQTFYRDAEDTYQGIKHVDMVPNLSAQNLERVNIGKAFMLKHGYIKNDFDVEKWAAPEFFEQAASELLSDAIKMKTMEKIPTMKGRVG